VQSLRILVNAKHFKMCRIMLPYSFYAQRVSSFTTNLLNLISSISWWKWNGTVIPRCQSSEWWILVFMKLKRGIKILCVLFWPEQELTTVYSVVWVPRFWNTNPPTSWNGKMTLSKIIIHMRESSQNDFPEWGGQWLTMRLNVMVNEFAFLVPS